MSQLIADFSLQVALTLTGNGVFLIHGRVRETAKTAITFVVFVRLSAWNNPADIKRIFIKFYICIFLKISVEKI
jgi:hypothetical protein